MTTIAVETGHGELEPTSLRMENPATVSVANPPRYCIWSCLWPCRQSWLYVHSCDWYEDLEQNVTEAALELPGVKARNVSVKVDGNHLVIYGQSRVGLAGRAVKGRYRMRERVCVFKRRLVLPENITVRSLLALRDLKTKSKTVCIWRRRISKRRWTMGCCSYHTQRRKLLRRSP